MWGEVELGEGWERGKVYKVIFQSLHRVAQYSFCYIPDLGIKDCGCGCFFLSSAKLEVVDLYENSLQILFNFCFSLSAISILKICFAHPAIFFLTSFGL